MTDNENPSRDLPESLRNALIALNANLQVPREPLYRWALKVKHARRLCEREASPKLRGALEGTTLEAAADEAQRQREGARRLGATLVTLLDDDYPPELLELALPPPVLYVRGRLSRRRRLAIVGSRHADRWALHSAAQIASAAARADCTVVSGFALGVDIAAHRAAADEGETVAVLGCGLAARYPKQHHDFAETIVRGGALITEFPLDASPKPQNFPIRNRIIAALARCTLVVQAAARSGALITARYATELGRDVAALPGRPGDARSAGANLLLRDGAQVVLEPADVLTLLGATEPVRTDSSQPREHRSSCDLLARLKAGGMGLDELVEATGQSAAGLQVQLLDLELDGLVECVAGRWERR